MKIALVGYGKMGKAIESIALQRGHEISLIIDHNNVHELSDLNVSKADVVIEFTNPENAPLNVETCIRKGLAVVCGSTGWHHRYEEMKQICIDAQAAMILSSNFSIGVNVFFELNAHLAKIMNRYPAYEVHVEEVHHVHKKDAPSGTAISIADAILPYLDRKEKWVLDQPIAGNDLSIISYREGEVPGTHSVRYSSDIDDIFLEHKAHSRSGFALGAVVAAEFLCGKKGVYQMKDVLGL